MSAQLGASGNAPVLLEEMESALTSYRPARESLDGLDLGGDDGGGLARYQDVADQHSSLQAQHGPLDLDAQAGPSMHLTYGALVAPPSYEDSVLYESVAQAMGLDRSGPSGAPGSTSHLTGPSQTSEQSTPGPSWVDHHTPYLTQQPQHAHPLQQLQSVLSSLRAARTSSRDQPLQISVTDPVKRDQAGLFGLRAGYVVYLVSTTITVPVPGYLPLAGAGVQAGGTARASTSQSNSQDTSAAPFCKLAVRRRFRDFVALADVLKVRFRGYFLPPRPEKNAVEGQRMQDSFVEERRVALERYLVRLTRHPTVASSQELRVFLSAEGELETCPAWTSLMPAPSANLVESTALLSKQLLGLEKSVLDPTQAVQPTKTSADIMRALKETAQSLQGSNGSTAVLPVGEQHLRSQRDRLEALKEALMLMSRAAEKLVHQMDRVASVQGEAGLAVFKLSKFEEQDGPNLAQFTGTVRQSQAISSSCKLLGTSLVKASRTERKAVGRAAQELGMLHEHMASMPAAIKGLTTREKQLLTADTLAAEVAARQRSIRDLEAAAGKTLGGDTHKARRMEELRNDIAKLECSIQAAHAEYDRIASVNQQELGRLQSEFTADMHRMCMALAASQAVSAYHSLDVYQQLAIDLGVPADQLPGVDVQATHDMQGMGMQQPLYASSSASHGTQALAGPEEQMRQLQLQLDAASRSSSSSGHVTGHLAGHPL